MTRKEFIAKIRIIYYKIFTRKKELDDIINDSYRKRFDSEPDYSNSYYFADDQLLNKYYKELDSFILTRYKGKRNLP